MRNIVPIGVGVVAGVVILRYMAKHQEPLLSRVPRVKKGMSGLGDELTHSPVYNQFGVNAASKAQQVDEFNNPWRVRKPYIREYVDYGQAPRWLRRTQPKFVRRQDNNVTMPITGRAFGGLGSFWLIMDPKAYAQRGGDQRTLFKRLLKQLDEDRIAGDLPWPDYVRKKEMYSGWLAREST